MRFFLIDNYESGFKTFQSKVEQPINAGPFPPVSPAYVDNERGSKEKIWFYDTCGIDNTNFNNSETIKNYIYCSDAIVLVYSQSDFTSFAILDSFKKLIDRIKEKKEVSGGQAGASHKFDFRIELLVRSWQYHTGRMMESELQIFSKCEQIPRG